jgi:hypothetical protein
VILVPRFSVNSLANAHRFSLSGPARLIDGRAQAGDSVPHEMVTRETRNRPWHITLFAGKRILAPGVERIEKTVDDGWLQAARRSSKGKSTAHDIVSKGGLDAGEAESLTLASSANSWSSSG